MQMTYHKVTGKSINIYSFVLIEYKNDIKFGGDNLLATELFEMTYFGRK